MSQVASTSQHSNFSSNFPDRRGISRRPLTTNPKREEDFHELRTPVDAWVTEEFWRLHSESLIELNGLYRRGFKIRGICREGTWVRLDTTPSCRNHIPKLRLEDVEMTEEDRNRFRSQVSKLLARRGSEEVPTTNGKAPINGTGN